MPPPAGAAARALRAAPVLPLLTATCAVTLLDLGDVLKHVLAHLPGRARQDLRSTCRALWTHSAIRASVDCVRSPFEALPERPIDWRILESLPHLAHLRLSHPCSLVNFSPRLASRLTRLTRITIGYTGEDLDLTPLNCATQLRALSFEMVPVKLQDLTLSQLTKLRLVDTPRDTDPSGLANFSCLQSLTISSSVFAGCLSQLQRLTQLHLMTSTSGQWGYQGQIQAVNAAAQRLPSLSVLKTWFPNPACTLGLTRLTALLVRASWLDRELHDLRELPCLQHLGLDGQEWAGTPPFRSSSLTSIFLVPKTGCSQQRQMLLAPDVSLCCALEHIMLRLEAPVFLVPAAHMPPQHVRLSVQTEEGEVYQQSGLDRRLHVRAVRKVAFRKEPVPF